jgi:hypothetical protein
MQVDEYLWGIIEGSLVTVVFLGAAMACDRAGEAYRGVTAARIARRQRASLDAELAARVPAGSADRSVQP